MDMSIFVEDTDHIAVPREAHTKQSCGFRRCAMERQAFGVGDLRGHEAGGARALNYGEDNPAFP